MRKVAGTAYFIAAILMMDTSVILATLSVYLSVYFVYQDKVPSGGFGYFFLFVVFAVFAVAGILLHRRGERYLQQPAEDVLLRDKRRPIVYLRSFSDDFASRPLMRFISRAEETLVLLNCLGPFIAIGRPDETLPLMGANRYYLNDIEWRLR
jgi:hypothetical protein